MRILIGCFEIPGYGGASTSAHSLLERLQRGGLDACAVNLVSEEHADFYRAYLGEGYGNPKALPGVYNCLLQGRLFDPHPALAALLRDLHPGVLVGLGYIPALLMKRAAPERCVVFLTTGSAEAIACIEEGRARDAVALVEQLGRATTVPRSFHTREGEAVRLADLVVPHSDLEQAVCRGFYPEHRGKIYPEVFWLSEWIYEDALAHAGLRRPFDERRIDVLFIASRWSRAEKNFGLLKRVAARLRGRAVHLVGESEERLPDVVHHGFVARRADLFALLGDARTVACPSRFDAAPGILFEAAAMGCNVVASKNCGNWRICHEALLVEPRTLDGYVEKISLSLKQKYRDNMDYFLRTRSYERLVELLSMLATTEIR